MAPRLTIRALWSKPSTFVMAGFVLYGSGVMLNDTDIETFRVLLVERQAELRAISDSSSGSRRPVELDQSRVGRLSRMDAMQDQAMALETARRRETELLRIAAALERVAQGEYGYCLSCGEEVAEKRLRFDPATPVCINCAT